MSIDSISRVNYFPDEFLLTIDFQDEQEYHRRMRERLSQGLLAPGIVKGLDVKWIHPATNLTVCAGTALDSEGRLIVLAQDTSYHPDSLTDGKQNYLVIGYGEQLGDLAVSRYGEGYKRCQDAPLISCRQDFDPNGQEVLLAVIAAAGGAIQAIYYCVGADARKNVGATLESVQYVDDSDTGPGPAASIAMTRDTLAISAPEIVLDGALTAAGVASANGSFSGSFSGVFKGDGTRLKLPSSTNYWRRDDHDDLYYTDGSVAIGDANASGACLTVRRGSTGQPSALLEVGGASMADPGRPPAIVVVQNGAGSSSATSVAINKSGAINSNYALEVDGPTLLEDVEVNKLAATGVVGITGDLMVHNDLAANKGITVANKLTADATANKVTVAQALDVKGDLVARGTADLKGPVAAEADLDVFDLTVGGTVSGAGDKVSVKQDLIVEHELSVRGTIVGASDPLATRGGLTTSGMLMVGSSKQAANATINGNLVVTGTINGKLAGQASVSLFGDTVGSGAISLPEQHSQHWINPDPYVYTPMKDGIFHLTTDNGYNNNIVDVNDWYSVTFMVTIGSMVLYSAALQEREGGPARAAMITAPVKGGTSISVKCFMDGLMDASFNVFIWFVPFLSM
jgi:hypothetical protein